MISLCLHVIMHTNVCNRYQESFFLYIDDVCVYYLHMEVYYIILHQHIIYYSILQSIYAYDNRHPIGYIYIYIYIYTSYMCYEYRDSNRYY